MQAERITSKSMIMIIICVDNNEVLRRVTVPTQPCKTSTTTNVNATLWLEHKTFKQNNSRITLTKIIANCLFTA